MTDMTDNPSNPDSAPQESALDLATLIRCAADDSLSMQQAEALRAHLAAHPEDQARIDFERGLRDAVATVMQTDPAPAQLRQSIEALLQQNDAPAETAGPRATRTRSFWIRSVLPLAVAAMILLTFGVTMMITSLNQPSSWNDGLATAVVSFVEREHNKCCDSISYRQKKLSITNVDDVLEKVQRDMGAVPKRIELDHVGYTFAGYGDCSVPGGPSGQLVYTPNNGTGSPISLFVQRDDGQLNSVATPADCLKIDKVFIWRADGLIYYLVTEPDGLTPDAFRSLGVPENQISL